MFLARSLSNCLKNVFFCRHVVISKAGRLRTGTQRDKINPKPIKKHTKRARELGTTTEKDAPLTCEHETWVRNLTAQSFEHDPPPGRDDDDDVTRTPQICPPDPAISRPIPSCPWGRTDRYTLVLVWNRPFYHRSGAKPTLLPPLWCRTGRFTSAAPAVNRPIPSCLWGRTGRATPALG